MLYIITNATRLNHFCTSINNVVHGMQTSKLSKFSCTVIPSKESGAVNTTKINKAHLAVHRRAVRVTAPAARNVEGGSREGGSAYPKESPCSGHPIPSQVGGNGSHKQYRCEGGVPAF